MPRILALVAVLTACAGSRRPLLAPYSPSVEAPATRPRIMTDVLDPSAAFLGLPSLATVSLPPDVREIRLSTGHGMILGAEYPLIRIVAGPDGVRGEIIRFRGIMEARDSSRPTVRLSARIVAPRENVDWRQLLQTLDSLGVETFIPPVYTNAIMDAGDLTVEVRRGRAYRAYEVNAPGSRRDSISARAAGMAGLVYFLERQTRGY